MSLSARLKHYFDSHRVSYHILTHRPTVTLCEAANVLNINPNMMVRTVVLGDSRGMCVAVLPLNYKIDFARLNRLLQRDLSILPRGDIDRLFCDCEVGSHPPFGEPYGLITVIDESLIRLQSLYFEPGTHTSLIRMSTNDFHYLMSNSIRGSFAVPVDEQGIASAHWTPQPHLTAALKALYDPELNCLGERLLKTYDIPALPEQVEKLKEWDCKQGAGDLSRILQENPSLEYLLLNVGNYLSNQQADRLAALDCESLDPDLLRYLAMAYYMTQPFEVVKNGPLGKKALWDQAVASALLMHAASEHFMSSTLPARQAFMAGLFHNLGYLLLGHLFVPEYQMLNKMVLFNPKTPVHILEKRIIGMGQAQDFMKKGHAKIGAWLLHHWQMPQSLIKATAEHHRPRYQGDEQECVQLLYLTDQFLKTRGMGDGAPEPYTIGPLAAQGIDLAAISEWFEEQWGPIEAILSPEK